MKRIIKNNYKIIIGILIGILLSLTSVYAIEAYIESKKVSYDNKYTDKNNVQEAIDELYEKSGIHQEKWIDPILNGADPVLKSPLIPVEIKPNGDVYYANLNSEWYNYSEKRWANAVILNDNVNHNVGDKIDAKDIKGYFVWIPRYKYKIWDLGNYTGSIEFNQITNTSESPNEDTAFWKVAGSNSKLIDIVFGDNTYVKVEGNTKQGSGISGGDGNVQEGNYLIHPAFILGSKKLNGFWMGKFETGGTSVTNTIVKPNAISWRGETVKTFFEAGKNFATSLDSHMMKNTEWGAVAYLSHSKYGIGNAVNINNNAEYKTGYSATADTDQRSISGTAGTSSQTNKTQPWNTLDGYLASITGNISGVYDMGGGTWEYVAACVENTPKDSDFTNEELNKYMNEGYIDKYDKASGGTTWLKRILGDATGEIGPFYSYYERNGVGYLHSSWYAESAFFVDSGIPWFVRGGIYSGGVFSGQFYFHRGSGQSDTSRGFRIVLSPN